MMYRPIIANTWVINIVTDDLYTSPLFLIAVFTHNIGINANIGIRGFTMGKLKKQ